MREHERWLEIARVDLRSARCLLKEELFQMPVLLTCIGIALIVGGFKFHKIIGTMKKRQLHEQELE